MAARLPSGLMVFDDRVDVALQVKIADCCERFRAKFGRWPKTIWLHRDTLGGYVSPNGLTLCTDYVILRNHFLVGPLIQEGGSDGGEQGRGA